MHSVSMLYDNAKQQKFSYMLLAPLTRTASDEECMCLCAVCAMSFAEAYIRTINYSYCEYMYEQLS